MLKYLTHKLRTQSINDENPANEKIDGHDSGTESDGDLDQEDELVQEHDMELSLSSRQDTASPTDTACSSESPAFLGQASHLLLYDQNSSEEELEVINGGIPEGEGSEPVHGSDGSSRIGSASGSTESVNQAGGAAGGLLPLPLGHRQLQQQQMLLSDVGDEIDDCAEELCLAVSPVAEGRLRPLAITPTHLGATKRCSSNNLLEKRKRSLAHSSDDEVRHLLEQHHQQQQPLMSAPVNFRTSPPLEALKPHRGHIIQRSTTPLILTESGRGLEHIRISSSSSISSTTSSLSSLGGGGQTVMYGGIGVGGLPTCDSPSTVINSNQHQHNHHHQHHHHHPSNNLALLSTTTNSAADTGGGATLVTNMEISRSVSPPAKVFHCAVSPRRRQSNRHHQQQRLQRPHRPCLDFDKMQQLKARSVTTWRHSNEHSGELSVFCW